MKGSRALYLWLLLLGGFSGCSSVNICRHGTTMVDIQNTGWYLFNFIPIASGRPNHPNRIGFKPFGGTVTLENNINMLRQVIEDEGALGYRNLTSYITDEHIFILLLSRHCYHTSAELIMKEDESCESPNL